MYDDFGDVYAQYSVLTGEDFTLTLRNSILDVQPRLQNADVTLTLTRELLNQVFTQEIDYATAIDQDLITVEGSKLALLSFGRAFDRDPGHPYLSLR